VPRILLVDDDKDLIVLVSEWLQAEQYLIDIARSGSEGLEYLRVGHYDAVILDIDLPEISGVEVCRRYRQGGGVAPIIMLTGKDQLADKELGLNSGADDYLTKPFHMRELSARVRAQCRRKHSTIAELLCVGQLKMDVTKHQLFKNGAAVHLVPKDFAVLEFLMKHPGEIFSSEAILHRVWSFDSEATTDAVRTSIKRLRSKLDDSDDEALSVIENVRRVGYRLRCES
jgi:two-component system OmpR family response regulator